MISAGGQVPAGTAGVGGLRSPWGKRWTGVRGQRKSRCDFLPQASPRLLALSGTPVVNCCVGTWSSSGPPHSDCCLASHERKHLSLFNQRPTVRLLGCFLSFAIILNFVFKTFLRLKQGHQAGPQGLQRHPRVVVQTQPAGRGPLASLSSWGCSPPTPRCPLHLPRSPDPGLHTGPGEPVGGGLGRLPRATPHPVSRCTASLCLSLCYILLAADCKMLTF